MRNNAKAKKSAKATKAKAPDQTANDNEALEKLRRIDEDLALGAEDPPAVKYTCVKNIAEGGLATKVLSLKADDELTKSAAVNIYEGEFEVHIFNGIAEFAQIFEDLEPSEALVYGVPAARKGRLVTQEKLKGDAVIADAIARDREHFSFPEGEPGVCMLDFDVAPGMPVQSWQVRDKQLCELVPEMEDVERVWRPSASAFVYRKDTGKQITGAGSWRCCFVVDNAAAIPAVGAFIYQAYWKAGLGWIFITKSGVMLDRAPVDAGVWQPERVDFAAPPIVREPLERRAPAPVVVPGLPYLRSSRVIAEFSLAEFRATSTEIAAEKRRRAPEAAKTRRKWLADRVARLRAEGCSLSEKRMNKVLSDAAEHLILGPEFILHPAASGSVTVGEILADREKWDGARFRDPLEPFGYDDARIAWASLSKGRPVVHTWGHGGLVFELDRTNATLLVAGGERSQQVDTCIEVMRARGDLYERSGEIVRPNGDGVDPVSEHWLSDYFDRAIRFEKRIENASGWYTKRIDAPRDVVSIVLAKRGQRGLRDLRAVISAPTLRPDGSLLCKPGYDEITGLLLKGGDFARVIEDPSPDQLRSAFATLWKPFSFFPFGALEHRGVFLAALLTGLVRRSLPTAPGFSFDAPLPATGKTLLALCIAALMGTTDCVIPEAKEEDELRKRLLAALRRGKPVILLDNIRDVFGSSALEAFLTSEFYSDRVLGVSEMSAFPTDVLLLISGNNFVPKGDLWRRLLTCRLDAKTDAPERRAFPFEPLDYCRRHRQQLVAAGLTLLCGFVAAGKPAATRDRLASFEAWDKLIRQAVIWLSSQGIADADDPAHVMAAAKERNPDRQKLATFLEAAHAVFGQGRFRVADLTNLHAHDFSDLTNGDAAKDALTEIVREIASERGFSINPRILGRWIERHADAPIGGRRLARIEHSETHKGSAVWRVAEN